MHNIFTHIKRIKPIKPKFNTSSNHTTFVKKEKVKVVQLDNIGDSITSADVIHTPLKKYQWVRHDTMIMALESGKGVVEINTPCNGMFMGYLVKKGDEIDVGCDIYNFYAGEPSRELDFVSKHDPIFHYDL